MLQRRNRDSATRNYWLETSLNTWRTKEKQLQSTSANSNTQGNKKYVRINERILQEIKIWFELTDIDCINSKARKCPEGKSLLAECGVLRNDKNSSWRQNQA